MSPAKSPAPEEFLPLTPAMYQILLALGDRPLHGYGIIQEFEARTGEKGALLPGSLYNTISRMLDAGLVEEPAERPVVANDDGRRRYYVVTELGRAVARAESARLRRLLDLAVDQNLAPAEG